MKVTASAAPMCKLCGARHSFAEPHVYPKSVTSVVTRSGKTATVNVTEAGFVTATVTPDTPNVTGATHRVTAYVPTEDELIQAAIHDEHECPICGFVHHRPQTTAERSKAYRERHAAP